jgi:hypothetical protein
LEPEVGGWSWRLEVEVATAGWSRRLEVGALRSSRLKPEVGGWSSRLEVGAPRLEVEALHLELRLRWEVGGSFVQPARWELFQVAA